MGKIGIGSWLRANIALLCCLVVSFVVVEVQAQTPPPDPTATPGASCTPPACEPPGRLVCPEERSPCIGGCGVECRESLPQTPHASCTPPACQPPGQLVCPEEKKPCTGGCGVECRESLPQTPTPDPTTTPDPTATPVPLCTPPACEPPGQLVCPEEKKPCTGGCGMECRESPPQCMPPVCKPPAKAICGRSDDCPGGCGLQCGTPEQIVDLKCTLNYIHNQTTYATSTERTCSFLLQVTDNTKRQWFFPSSCIIAPDKHTCSAKIDIRAKPWGVPPFQKISKVAVFTATLNRTASPDNREKVSALEEVRGCTYENGRPFAVFFNRPQGQSEVGVLHQFYCSEKPR